MSVTGNDTLKTRSTLTVDGKSYDYFSLDKAASAAGLGDVSRLPFSLKVLLEILVRLENGRTVTVDDIKALGAWLDNKSSDREIAFRPARVLMQDLTGVPAVVDLAAMRQAMVDLGGDPKKINPLSPVDLVIDHSVQIDNFGNAAAFAANVKTEFERNGERYRFLRWGQDSFENFRLVPPGTGICHQVNLEYLSQVVWTTDEDGKTIAYPDTLVGTDSHTTMVNGLSVLRLGWSAWHRGRGDDARPATLDADPRSRWHETYRQVARGRDRDRPRATRDADAAPARRCRKVCRVLRARYRRAGARRPRDDRQHGARIRRDLWVLPDRRFETISLPGPSARATRRASSSSRPMPRRKVCGATRIPPTQYSPTRWNSTSPRSSRRWPDRAGRRTGWRSPTPARGSTPSYRASHRGSPRCARPRSRGRITNCMTATW